MLNIQATMYEELEGLQGQSSSISQVSSKAQKKQLIRDKAVALLQKVKSE